MTSPQTINSGDTVFSIASSPPPLAAVPTVDLTGVSSSQRSATIEHVLSSPRPSSISSEDLDVPEARAEAAKAVREEGGEASAPRGEGEE